MRNKYDASHVMCRDGVYYYVRRIPCDLTSFYSVKRFCFSLKTKSLKAANRSAASISQRLDDYWLNLRLKEAEIPAAHLLRSIPSQNIHSTLPTITDALDLYHRVKGHNKRTNFFTHSKRSVDYLIKCLGCRSLDQYSSADAATFRDWLRNKGLSTASVQRNFTSIKAMVNFTILELGLDCRNPFSGVYLAFESSTQKRQPLTNQ